MSADLFKDLRKEFGEDGLEIVDTPTTGVKDYVLKINDKTFFEFHLDTSKGPPPDIPVKPHDKWTNPINYTTHVGVMGEHARWKVDELIAAIKAS